MSFAFNIEDILTSMQSGSTDEQMIQKIAGITPKSDTTSAPIVPVTEPEKVAELSKDEIEKLAEEAVDQGRIMAWAFMDQLGKYAVDETPLRPVASEVPENPAVQLASTPVGQNQTAPADAVIQSLVASTKAGGPQGTIGVQGGQAMPISGSNQNEAPVAADAGKTASNEVISKLFAKYCQGE